MPPIYIVPWRHCFFFKTSSAFLGTLFWNTMCIPQFWHLWAGGEGGGEKTRWILEAFTTFSLLFTWLMSVWLISPAWLSEGIINVLDYPVTLNFNFYQLGSLKEHLCASVSFRMPLLCRPIDLWLKGWKSIKMRWSSWAVCLFRLELMQKPVFT